MRETEREVERNLDGGPDCRRRQRAPLTGAEAEAQRQSNEPMTASTMLICKKENTERKTEIKIKERETEKESERKKSEIP